MSQNALQYPFVDSYSYALMACGCRTGGIQCNPVYNWLLYGKLPEDVVVTSSNVTQFITPSARNRYIASVTILPATPIVSTVNVTGTGVVTRTAPSGAVTVVVDNTTVATATLANGIITITGVAAGTTVARVYNTNGTLIELITIIDA